MRVADLKQLGTYSAHTRNRAKLNPYLFSYNLEHFKHEAIVSSYLFTISN